MATVIERERDRPVERRVIVEREVDSGAGWVVALILILAALAVGAFIFFRYYNGGSTVNVTLPQVTTTPAPQTPVGTTGAASQAPANTGATTGTGANTGGTPAAPAQ